MVFFVQTMRQTVVVPPSALGPRLKEHVREALYGSVEGQTIAHTGSQPISADGSVLSSSSAGAGFIVAVTRFSEGDIKGGVIDHLNGHVKYSLRYDALVFRPFKNEVMDAVVTSVTDLGIRAEAGPTDVFVGRPHMPMDMEMMAADSSYTSSDTGVKIRVGSAIRVRVLGIAAHGSMTHVVASINEAHLGLLT